MNAIIVHLFLKQIQHVLTYPGAPFRLSTPAVVGVARLDRVYHFLDIILRPQRRRGDGGGGRTRLPPRLPVSLLSPSAGATPGDESAPLPPHATSCRARCGAFDTLKQDTADAFEGAHGGGTSITAYGGGNATRPPGSLPVSRGACGGSPSGSTAGGQAGAGTVTTHVVCAPSICRTTWKWCTVLGLRFFKARNCLFSPQIIDCKVPIPHLTRWELFLSPLTRL